MFKEGDVVLCVKSNPYPSSELVSQMIVFPQVSKHYTIKQIQSDCACGDRDIRLVQIINYPVKYPYFMQCGKCLRLIREEISFPSNWFIKLNDQDLKEPAENYETILNDVKASFAKEAQKLAKKFKELIIP